MIGIKKIFKLRYISIFAYEYHQSASRRRIVNDAVGIGDKISYNTSSINDIRQNVSNRIAFELTEYFSSKNYHKIKKCDKDLKIGSDVYQYDVKISTSHGPGFIHTLQSKEDREKIIVLVHGFGASGVSMIKLMKELQSKFQVYCIDLPGMGLSSRDQFVVKNPEEAVQYFVNAIEQWRKACGIQQQFILGGHSLGGYMSGMYFRQFEDRIEQLVMISPLGMRSGGEETNSKIDAEYQARMNLLTRFAYNQIRGYFQKQKSLSQIYQGPLFPSRWFLNSYMERRLGLKDKELELWKLFFHKVLSMDKSSEACLYELFEFPSLIPKIPLINAMVNGQNSTPIEFHYGVHDWMKDEEAKQLISSFFIKGTIDYISSAGHQIPIENPKELADQIISNTFK